MKITANMNLDDLAERMGDTPSNYEVCAMRALLCGSGFEDTADIPEQDWIELLGQCVVQEPAGVQTLIDAHEASNSRTA